MLEIIQHGSVRELRLARAPVNALNSELITTLDAAKPCSWRSEFSRACSTSPTSSRMSAKRF